MRAVAAKRLTPEEFQSRLSAKFPDRWKVLSYTHSMEPARVACGRCDTIKEARADEILKGKTKCLLCEPRVAAYHARSKDKISKILHPGISHAGSEPVGTNNRLVHSFYCHKHGLFSMKRALLSPEIRCPRCFPSLPPNHPDLIPRGQRGRAAVLYLLEIRDATGKWLKVGISTNFPNRKKMYAREGVKILREIRVEKMTLFRAAWTELELKRWGRRVLGRRPTPKKRWSGWSECFKDRAGQFVSQFDKILVDTRFAKL